MLSAAEVIYFFTCRACWKKVRHGQNVDQTRNETRRGSNETLLFTPAPSTQFKGIHDPDQGTAFEMNELNETEMNVRARQKHKTEFRDIYIP